MHSLFCTLLSLCICVLVSLLFFRKPEKIRHCLHCILSILFPPWIFVWMFLVSLLYVGKPSSSWYGQRSSSYVVSYSLENCTYRYTFFFIQLLQFFNGQLGRTLRNLVPGFPKQCAVELIWQAKLEDWLKVFSLFGCAITLEVDQKFLRTESSSPPFTNQGSVQVLPLVGYLLLAKVLKAKTANTSSCPDKLWKSFKLLSCQGFLPIHYAQSPHDARSTERLEHHYLDTNAAYGVTRKTSVPEFPTASCRKNILVVRLCCNHQAENFRELRARVS